jgi:hypothetical protein
MKQFIVYKLDRRHSGYSQFTHYVVPVWSSRLEDRLKFFEWRKWCWESWGPGVERDIAIELGFKQFDVCRWAWHTSDKHSRRLYFASEKELSWFILKWSSEDGT